MPCQSLREYPGQQRAFCLHLAQPSGQFLGSQLQVNRSARPLHVPEIILIARRTPTGRYHHAPPLLAETQKNPPLRRTESLLAPLGKNRWYGHSFASLHQPVEICKIHIQPSGQPATQSAFARPHKSYEEYREHYPLRAEKPIHKILILAVQNTHPPPSPGVVSPPQGLNFSVWQAGGRPAYPWAWVGLRRPQ